MFVHFKKKRFFIKNAFTGNLQKTADLFTFTEEIFNEELLSWAALAIL